MILAPNEILKFSRDSTGPDQHDTVFKKNVPIIF